MRGNILNETNSKLFKLDLSLKQGLILKSVVSRQAQGCLTYRLSRTLSKGLALERGLILKPVVSGRRFDWLLHCFFNVIEGGMKKASFFNRILIFSAGAIEGTNITQIHI